MYLVVGSGFLGSYMLKTLRENTSEQIIGTIRNNKSKVPGLNVKWYICDVTNKSSVERLSDKLQAEKLTVFYFAACHNIDFVYENPRIAKEINLSALEYFLSTFKNIDKLFFASTDCVYGENDSAKPRFKESDTLNPLNEYGRQKAEAEKKVASYGFTVVRLPFMLGPSLTSKLHFYDNITAKLRTGESIEMIDGQKRSVLSYKDTAELLFSVSQLPNNILPPIINLCGDKEYTKYDVGCILAKKNNSSISLIRKLTEQQGKKFFKDARASSAVMDNSLLKQILNLSEVHWEEDK